VVTDDSVNDELEITVQRAALTGDVTASVNSNATTIANNAVSDAKFRQSAGLSVVGRSASTLGNVADITASADNQVLRRSGTSIGFGLINGNNLDNGSIDNTKAADMAGNTIKANPTASTAAPQDLAISTSSFPARVGGNLVSHPFSTLVGNALSYNGAGVINVETRTDRHIYIDTTIANNPLGYRKSVQHHYWYEDFDYIDAEGTITTAGGRSYFQQTAWGVIALNASGSIARVTPTSSHPGVVSLTTGAASGNAMILFNGTGTTPGDRATRADGIQQMEFVLSISSTTNIGMLVGFMDGSAINNSILFIYDTGAGHTTVQTRTQEGGVSTVKDTGVAPGTGFRLYTIRQETAQTIDFYIDDVLETTHSSVENVPDTETGSVMFYLISRGAATRTMNIDYAMFESVDLGTR
jgi:hypothetical protein